MTTDRQTRTMIQAADERDWQQVVMSASAGANVDADDGYVIRKAAEHGEFGVVDYLAKSGANIHYQDDYALRIATGHGHAETVKVLIEHGADVQARNNAALIEATEDDAAEIAKLLLASGADVNAQGDAALKTAIANDSAQTEQVIRTYISERGMEAMTRFNSLFGETPELETLRTAFNADGDTGLILAARGGVFDRIMDRHADRLSLTDLTATNAAGDSVVSVLARDNRLSQLSEPKYWVGRTDVLKEALAAVPEIYRAQYDLVSIFDRAKLRSLRSRAPQHKLKPKSP